METGSVDRGLDLVGILGHIGAIHRHLQVIQKRNDLVERSRSITWDTATAFGEGRTVRGRVGKWEKGKW